MRPSNLDRRVLALPWIRRHKEPERLLHSKYEELLMSAEGHLQTNCAG